MDYRNKAQERRKLWGWADTLLQLLLLDVMQFLVGRDACARLTGKLPLNLEKAAGLLVIFHCDWRQPRQTKFRE